MSLYLAGTGARIGEARAVTSTTGGQEQVTEAEAGAVSVEYALSAARDALTDSGHEPDHIGTLIHQVVLGDLPPMTEPASYVQRELGLGPRCRVAEMRQGCNGLAALEWVAGALATRPGQPAALVSAADFWRLPTIDRERCSPGFQFGDGAAAWVISRDAGFARVKGLAYRTDPELEGMSRGDELHGDRPLPVSLDRRAREFARRMPTGEQSRRKVEAIRAVTSEALEEGGTTLDAIRWFVIPHLAAWLTDRDVCRTLGIGRELTTWHVGRRIGHLGAADVLAGLHRLRETPGSLAVGDEVLCLAYGSGFTYSALVATVEDARRPIAADSGLEARPGGVHDAD